MDDQDKWLRVSEEDRECIEGIQEAVAEDARASKEHKLADYWPARSEKEVVRDKRARCMMRLGWPPKIADAISGLANFERDSPLDEVKNYLTGLQYRNKNEDGKLEGFNVDRKGRLLHFVDGELHRDDGPAVIEPDGSSHRFFQNNAEVHPLDIPGPKRGFMDNFPAPGNMSFR